MKKLHIFFILACLLPTFMASSLILASCDSDSSKTTCTVTFDRNGGSGAVPAAQTVAAGSSITLPSKKGLSRDGYTFGGWNTKKNGTGTNYRVGSSYTVTGTVTLYAKWIADGTTEFTVSFNLNDGTGTTPSAETVSSGSIITLPYGNDLIKIGFTFGGWNINADGTGTNYAAGSSYTVTGTITLYARWIADGTANYTVTFNLNDGMGTTPSAQTVAAGSSIIIPNENGLSKTGFTFGGWNTNADGMGTNYNAGSSYTVTGNITLYAKWIADGTANYTVTFNLNDGMGTTPSAQTVAAGSSIIIPNENGLSKTGFTFGGWNTNADGTGTNYAAGSSYTVTGTITLYAKWIAAGTAEFTVTFNSNGGTGTTPSAQTAVAGSSIIIPNENGLSKTGFTFGGWNANADGTGANYAAGSSYTVTGTVTLYAKWIAIYTVTFGANGGNGMVPNAMPTQAGSSLNLPSGSGLTKTDYTFGGWNTNTNGTGTNYNAGSSYAVTGNVTLYAKWMEKVVVSNIGIELVYVSGGSFQMGNTADSNYFDGTVRTVTLTSGFYMGKYQVTQAQYETVTGINLSHIAYGKGDNYPVYYVMWYDAVEFCNKLSEQEGLTPYYTINKTVSDPNNTNWEDTYKWLVTWNMSADGYRLPTGAEWEYAAKGGNGSPGNYAYAGGNTVGDVAWYSNNSRDTHEVGTKDPNGLGIYDMSGNVEEWCWDWHSVNTSSEAQTDPTGVASGNRRVRRGGSWSHAANGVRSSSPSFGEPFNNNGYVGFRVARPAQ